MTYENCKLGAVQQPNGGWRTHSPARRRRVRRGTLARTHGQFVDNCPSGILIALAIARQTGRRIGLDLSTRMAMDAVSCLIASPIGAGRDLLQHVIQSMT